MRKMKMKKMMMLRMKKEKMKKMMMRKIKNKTKDTNQIKSSR